MLVLLVFLWTIAVILIVTDPKTESTRWVSAIAFFSGLGGLAVVVVENIIPYIEVNITKNPIRYYQKNNWSIEKLKIISRYIPCSNYHINTK